MGQTQGHSLLKDFFCFFSFLPNIDQSTVAILCEAQMSRQPQGHSLLNLFLFSSFFPPTSTNQMLHYCEERRRVKLKVIVYWR